MFSFPPCISLIIVERQNYFHRNFRLEKIFPEICNNMHLPIWNFKVTTNLPPSVFTCSFFNNIEYIFWDLRCVSLDIWPVLSFYYTRIWYMIYIHILPFKNWGTICIFVYFLLCIILEQIDTGAWNLSLIVFIKLLI